MHGVKQTEIANHFGMTKQRVYWIIKANQKAVALIAKYETGSISRRIKLLELEDQMRAMNGGKLFIDTSRHDALDVLKVQNDIDKKGSIVNVQVNLGQLFNKELEQADIREVSSEEDADE